MPKLDTPTNRPNCTQAPYPVQDILDTFNYCPETGDLYYKDTQDKVVTAYMDGGLFTRVGRKQLAVHRLCWCVHYKQWPSFYLRHLNGDSCDNRIINLARATWANDPSRQPSSTAPTSPTPSW